MEAKVSVFGIIGTAGVSPLLFFNKIQTLICAHSVSNGSVKSLNSKII